MKTNQAKPSGNSKFNFPLILLLLSAASASAATRHVWQDTPSPGPPYTTWDTAARTIQAAVDAAAAGDEIVVTNGLYATGGRAVYGNLVNRVAVNKPLTVRSVNGPQFTIIQGQQVPDESGGWMGCGAGAIRCAYLTGGATLTGFTLTTKGLERTGARVGLPALRVT